jgi:hypothetical protein
MKNITVTLLVSFLGVVVVAIAIMSAAPGTWADRNILVVSLLVFVALCWIFR